MEEIIKLGDGAGIATPRGAGRLMSAGGSMSSKTTPRPLARAWGSGSVAGERCVGSD